MNFPQFSLVSIAIKHLLLIAVSVDSELTWGKRPTFRYNISLGHSTSVVIAIAVCCANVRERWKHINAEIMLPCGALCAALQAHWFPSGVHQLFLLLQVAQTTWGVTLFEQSNTEQNWSGPTVAAPTCALQSEHLPSKVNSPSEKHDWRLDCCTHISLSNMCVIGTTQRRCRNVNCRMCGDTYGHLFVLALRIVGRFVWSCVCRESVHLKLMCVYVRTGELMWLLPIVNGFV